MTTYYVAGSTSDIDRVQDVQQRVREFSGVIVHDWTRQPIRDGVWGEAPATAAQVARDEVSAACEADVTIVISPPNGLGCWVEMGCALAAGRRVWVINPPRDSVFFHHPLVTCAPLAALDDLLFTHEMEFAPNPTADDLGDLAA